MDAGCVGVALCILVGRTPLHDKDITEHDLCRFPPTTSGKHLLDKYAETHSGYDASAKAEAVPVTLEG